MKFSRILIASLIQGAALAVDEAEAPQKGTRHGQLGNKPNFLRDPSKPAVRTLSTAENRTNTRIVGGSQSEVGEFPYYVDLAICGGSLIAPDVVLTAAHCGSFIGERVIVGAFKYGSTNNGAVKVKVVDEVKHPWYNDWNLKNDFLLLKLARPVTIPNPNNVVLSVNEEPSTPVSGEDLTVLGLGVTSSGGWSPSKLRDVVVKAVSTYKCNRPKRYGGAVAWNMFCAGDPDGGKDSCQGDSGGPIVKKVGNQHIQVGVVSWGIGCGRKSKPGVYARVSSASNWIKEVVCDQWNSQGASICAQCEDKSDWKFESWDGKKRNCNYVARKPNRRCSKVGLDETPASESCGCACAQYGD